MEVPLAGRDRHLLARRAVVPGSRAPKTKTRQRLQQTITEMLCLQKAVNKICLMNSKYFKSEKNYSAKKTSIYPFFCGLFSDPLRHAPSHPVPHATYGPGRAGGEMLGWFATTEPGTCRQQVQGQAILLPAGRWHLHGRRRRRKAFLPPPDRGEDRLPGRS